MTRLWQQAKDMVLKDGDHVPTIYAESKDGDQYLIAIVGMGGATAEKYGDLFNAGREVGRKNQGKELTFLCFVTEAWVSKLKPGEKRKCAPSKDPNRSEFIIAQTMDLTEKPVKQMVYMAEMLRDASGALINLLPDNEPVEAEWTLLPPFLAGWHSAKYSNRELKEMAKQQQRKA